MALHENCPMHNVCEKIESGSLVLGPVFADFLRKLEQTFKEHQHEVIQCYTTNKNCALRAARLEKLGYDSTIIYTILLTLNAGMADKP